jgi:membrane protease subunit HflK
MSQQPPPLPQFDPASIRQIVRIALFILVVLVALSALRSVVFSVEPEEKAVIQRFGKVIDIKGPGLHFKLPLGIDTARFVPTERVLKEEFGFRTTVAAQRSQYAKTPDMQNESLMLTGDLNVIDVEWVVQYRVSDPVKFLFQVRDPRDTIRDISEAVMRRIVGNRLGSEVLTIGRVAIADEVLREMKDILNSYDMGINIQRIELQDVTPPETVKPAFNEVNEARQQREKLVNEAEKERNRVIPRARGEADQIVAEAEAYRAERTNQARGEAARFTSLLSAYLESPEVTKRRLYLESIEEVLPKLGKITVIEEGGTSPVPLLHLGEPKGGDR